MESRITAISVQKKNSQRINVFVDSCFSFSVSRIVGAWLKVDQTISQQKISELILADDLERAFQSAANFIQYRIRSEAEVEQNLKKKGFTEPIINNTVNRLKEAGMVNDEEFARQWVEIRITTKPRSRRLLEYELRQKKVDHLQIQQAIASIPDELTLAVQAARKKLPQFNNLEKDVFTKKVSSYLLRKGFGYEVIRQAIEQLWEELSTQNRLAQS